MFWEIWLKTAQLNRLFLLFLLPISLKLDHIEISPFTVSFSEGVLQVCQIQSAGVAPERNLRNSWHAGDKARKRGIHPGFETQGRRHQKSKTGVSVAPGKGLMFSKN